MKGQTIILQGGEDVNRRTNAHLFRKLAEISVAKKILVIPWTGPVESEAKYHEIFLKYFTESGFAEVIFLERSDNSEMIDGKFSSVDTVYLAGGDTGILIGEMDARSIPQRLKIFRGTIVGNSAGAIALSLGMKLGDRSYIGYGLVDFFVTVHHKLCNVGSFPSANMENTVNIPEDMWICVYR